MKYGRTFAWAATAMIASVASHAQAATLVIDVAGVKSFGPAGAAGNAATSYDLGAGTRITGISWDVNTTALGINRLSDATFRYGATPDRAGSVMLNPGVGQNFAGTASYSGSSVFSSDPFIVTTGASGLLYTQFYDFFPYSGGSTHIQWNSGTITLTYEPAIAAVPEPATWGLLMVGFGAVGVALRRRRPARLHAV